MRLPALSALAASLAAAQVLDTASFGHQDGHIVPHQRNWHMSDVDGWTPQILSDKIILTPPWPGNRKGAFWTTAPISYNQWSAEVEFRASGQEHGGGNLQIWYTKEGKDQIGVNSLHTVNKFEGLVIVVDMHGGYGGMVRGFLNDGSSDYANHPHLESLAFGRCMYSYRNRGRPSKITLTQDATGFEVKVDDGRCFRSDSVLLPSSNYFGVSATSTDTPDSFEVFKFVTTLSHSNNQAPPAQQQQQQQQQQQKVIPPQGQENRARADPGNNMIPDVLASTLKDQQAQFEDLHNRVQGIAHQVDTSIQEIQRTAANIQARMEELHQQVAKQQHVSNLESRLTNLENSLNSVKNSQKDWSGHFNDIHASLKARHDTLLDVLPGSVGGVISSSAPNFKLFVFLVLGFQAMLAVSYVVYKRRMAQGPKKYL